MHASVHAKRKLLVTVVSTSLHRYATVELVRKVLAELRQPEADVIPIIHFTTLGDRLAEHKITLGSITGLLDDTPDDIVCFVAHNYHLEPTNQAKPVPPPIKLYPRRRCYCCKKIMEFDIGIFCDECLMEARKRREQIKWIDPAMDKQDKFFDYPEPDFEDGKTIMNPWVDD